MKLRQTIIIGALIVGLALLALSCGTSQNKQPYDAVSGFASTNYTVPSSLLIPDSIRLDSDYKQYYMGDKIIFVGRKDSSYFALSLLYRRALEDNKFKRAERSFEGYLFDGRRWIFLTYTQARQDTTMLDPVLPFYFTNFRLNDKHTGGSITYDRRDIKFELKFENLAPVQGFEQGENGRWVQAIGTGSFSYEGATINGTIYYQLVELEGYNPMADRGQITNHINFNWLGLLTDSGGTLVTASDTLTPNEQLYKNFVAYNDGDSTLYAEGASLVRITSDDIRRDAKIGDYLALRKELSVPDLNLQLVVDLTDDRFFSSYGYCFAIVRGSLEIAGQSQSVWGLLDHLQQPNSDSQVLR
jgi:hypothetical protein